MVELMIFKYASPRFLKNKIQNIYIMNLLESKLNSIAAIAIETSLNSARIDYVNENLYNKADAVTALNSKQKTIVEAPATVILGQYADYIYFIDSTSITYPFSHQKILCGVNLTITFRLILAMNSKTLF